jgi:ABC-2 type transport system ATP-binding protein
MNQERLSKDEQERARILRIEAEQRRLKKAEEENKEGGNDKRYGSFEARINDVILSCDDGKRTETLETGRKAMIEIDYSVETPVKRGISALAENEEFCMLLSSYVLS